MERERERERERESMRVSIFIGEKERVVFVILILILPQGCSFIFLRGRLQSFFVSSVKQFGPKANILLLIFFPPLF